MTEGIIFVGTEAVNITQAKLAVKSIRKHCGNIHITMFTNTPELVPEKLFDSVITIEKKGGTKPFKTYDKVLQLLNTPYDKTLFMDTDIFVMDDLREMFRVLDKFDMAFAHAHTRNERNEIYHNAGALDRNYTPYAFPIIQSGVILYKKSPEVWKTLTDYKDTYERKKYFFDQASFKEVLWNSSIRLWVLPPEYNFNSLELLRYWRKENFKTATPKIFHYTMNKKDDIEKVVNHALRAPFKEKVRKGLGLIKRVIKKVVKKIDIRESVSDFFAKDDGITEANSKNIIITGISRSGTSYICNLLHRYNNCVILNEPPDIFAPLINEQKPKGVLELYLRYRRNINKKRPIINKLKDGKVTEDTAVHEMRQEYVPKVRDKDFVLGVKNNVAYMSSIDRVREVMPNARIVMCARDPYDTIASWKVSFPHLRDAEIEKRPVGHPEDQWLPEARRAELRIIAAEKDLAAKRAMVWNYFAERIIEQLPKGVGFIRYSEMVSDPMKIIKENFGNFDLGDQIEAIEPSPVRSKRDNLDEHDYKMIEKYCSESARKLGLLNN